MYRPITILLILIFGQCLWSSERQATLYDENPDHLWNEMHAALWMRTAPDGTHHAEGTLDLPLFKSTRSILSGDSYQRVIDVLDAFNQQSQEEIAEVSPLERAWMQRELWAAFDWSTEAAKSFFAEEQHLNPAVRTMQTRLERAIRLLALTTEEIAELPSPYSLTLASEDYATAPETLNELPPYEPSLPYLPNGLDPTTSRWAFVEPIETALPGDAHFRFFTSRSAFLVAVRLPKGEISTEAYLSELGSFRPAWIPSEEESIGGPTLPHGGIHEGGMIPNPETPQFPAGTQWALIRKAMLINQEGRIVVSPLVESIQLRTYLTVEENGSNQALAEFLLSPGAYLSGGTPLVAQTGEEKLFVGFLQHDIDRFEKSEKEWSDYINYRKKPGLSCYTCHSGWGIHGVNSRAQLFSPRLAEPVTLVSRTIDRIENGYIREKEKRYDWGLLKGLMQSQEGED